MKTTVSAMLVAAIIAIGGVLVYAMGGHGGVHHGGSGNNSGHIMDSNDQHMMDHGDRGHDSGNMGHDQNMPHGQGMNYGYQYDEEDLITTGDAEKTVNGFLSSNMHGYKVKNIWFVDGDMMSPPMYEADVVLADGSEGVVMIDALTGDTAGILVGKYVNIMRNAGHQSMGDHDSMHSDSMGNGEHHQGSSDSASENHGEHSAHNH